MSEDYDILSVSGSKYPWLRDEDFTGHETEINKEWSEAYHSGKMHLLDDLEARREVVREARAKYVRDNPKPVKSTVYKTKPHYSRSYGQTVDGQLIDQSDFEFYSS